MTRSWPSRMLRNAARWVVGGPLRLLPPTSRARVLESINEQMVLLVATNRGPIRFYCPTPLLMSRAASMLAKEPDTIQWIDGFLPDDVFWDIGANVGVFSLYAASMPGVSVRAFEPLASNFHVLSKNFQLNRLGSRAIGYCIAFSGRTGLGILNVDSPAMGSALSHFGEEGEMSKYAHQSSPSAIQGMLGFTVDDFVERFSPPFPTHLKVDVDGLELEILGGAEMTLRDPRLRSAIVELSLSDVDQSRRAVGFLAKSGLELVSMGAPQGTPPDLASNHLFRRGGAADSRVART